MVRSNVHTLLTVFVRVVAIAFLLQAFVQFAIGYWTYGGPVSDDSQWRTLAIAMPLVTLLLCAAVWLFADVLVRCALARPDGATFESTLDAADWQRVGFSVIGLWFAAVAVVDLVATAGSWMHLRALQQDYPDTDISLQLLPDVFGALSQLVLGASLLLGARGLQGLVARLRGR